MSGAFVSGAGECASVDDHNGVALHFLHRGRGLEFDMEARWIRAQLPPTCERVADVGCGNGALFPWLGAHRVVGIDFLPDGLRLTRERFQTVPLMAGCAEELPVKAGSLDAIVMQHVVEHLYDVEEAVRGWHRSLRVGGRLIIVTPNVEFLDPSVYDDPTHTHIFSRRELRDVLEAEGFEIEDLRTLGLPYFRGHSRVPGGWRLRRGMIDRAEFLSCVPGLAAGGQSLCCMARRGA